MRTGSENFVERKILFWTQAYLRLDWKYTVTWKTEGVILLIFGGPVLHCDEFHIVDYKKVTFCSVLTFSVQNTYKYREGILKASKRYYSIAMSRVLFALWKAVARQPHNIIPNPPFSRTLQIVGKFLKT